MIVQIQRTHRCRPAERDNNALTGLSSYNEWTACAWPSGTSRRRRRRRRLPRWVVIEQRSVHDWTRFIQTNASRVPMTSMTCADRHLYYWTTHTADQHAAAVNVVTWRKISSGLVHHHHLYLPSHYDTLLNEKLVRNFPLYAKPMNSFEVRIT